MLQKYTVDNFILETVLIKPVSDIVQKLETHNFRDCDIKWLNEKLKIFTSFALETLGKKFELGEVGSDIMNDYTRNRFLKYFNTLLLYFKDLIK